MLPRRSVAGLPAAYSPQALLAAYHQRSKHGLSGYAAGPESLDWDAQPDPFRRYTGSPSFELPFGELPTTEFASIFTAEVAAQPLTQHTLSSMLMLSLALSAWKALGEERWAVRCHPSSGNLHPIEAYLLLPKIESLPAGMYHYAADAHVLEQRGLPVSEDELPAHCFWLGLTTASWREAWKYGERSWRYCQLDSGHAMATIRLAAAVLGWRVVLETEVVDATLATMLGVDRADDFTGVESEVPALLLRIECGEAIGADPSAYWLQQQPLPAPASRLDPYPLYDWQVIAQVESASRRNEAYRLHAHREDYAALALGRVRSSAAQLIRQRRSAQGFDPDAVLPLATFIEQLSLLLPRHGVVPFDLWCEAPNIHPVIWVHQVQGVAPGLYALPRSTDAAKLMVQALDSGFLWQAVAEVEIPLYLLAEGHYRKLCKTLCCHQAIAANAAYTVGFLADCQQAWAAQPWRYRQRYWEAGLLGQILYLAAEAHGFRATGIGCYFDDAVHQHLGIQGERWQCLYHFTVGTALHDPRIQMLSPYSSSAG